MRVHTLTAIKRRRIVAMQGDHLHLALFRPPARLSPISRLPFAVLGLCCLESLGPPSFGPCFPAAQSIGIDQIRFCQDQNNLFPGFEGLYVGSEGWWKVQGRTAGICEEE